MQRSQIQTLIQVNWGIKNQAFKGSKDEEELHQTCNPQGSHGGQTYLLWGALNNLQLLRVAFFIIISF